MLILCFCSYLTWTGNTASHCSGESAQAAFLKFSDHFLRTILLVSKLSKTYQLDLPTTWSKIPFPSFVPSLVLPIDYWIHPNIDWVPTPCQAQARGAHRPGKAHGSGLLPHLHASQTISQIPASLCWLHTFVTHCASESQTFFIALFKCHLLHQG